MNSLIMIGQYLNALVQSDAGEFEPLNGRYFIYSGLADVFVNLTDEGYTYTLEGSGEDVEDVPLATVSELKTLIDEWVNEDESEDEEPELIEEIDSVTAINGEYQLIDISSVDIAPLPETEEIRRIAQEIGTSLRTSIVPIVRVRWNPDCSTTTTVITNPEAIAFAKAVRAINPRVELVSAYVTK
jgi:hypothetical protein